MESYQTDIYSELLYKFSHGVNILPYYGYFNECQMIMNSLSKDTYNMFAKGKHELLAVFVTIDSEVLSNEDYESHTKYMNIIDTQILECPHTIEIIYNYTTCYQKVLMTGCDEYSSIAVEELYKIYEFEDNLRFYIKIKHGCIQNSIITDQMYSSEGLPNLTLSTSSSSVMNDKKNKLKTVLVYGTNSFVFQKSLEEDGMI